MAELQEYKCPACGGPLAFDSDLQKMKCPFCESVFTIEDIKTTDATLTEEMTGPDAVNTDSMHWDATEEGEFLTYSCQSCGAEIVADKTTGATHCPYCNNPVVMRGQFSGSLRPDLIIPFKLNKEHAKAELKKFYRGRFFLPKTFKSENKINEIRGLYVPFWLYSGESKANIEYKATKIRTWSDSKYNYTETKTYRILRKGAVRFSNIPVDGSKKMPNDLMDSIEPYSVADASSFQTAYMAGYVADKYDEDAQQCIPRANTRVENSTKSVFAGTVTGYHSVTPKHSIVKFGDVSVKYILLPVWMLITSWQGGTYTFAMNGQTGKMMGKLPINQKKKWGLFAAIMAVLVGLSVWGIFGIWRS